jgi:AsmA protein
MRAIKIAALVVGGLIGLLVLLAIVVALWIDPNDYRGEIEKRAAQATGRPLHIGGKLDLKLFPWIALQVSDVSLGNPAGYGTEPFLTVKHADVGVKLLPLLHKELEVRRITLEGLAVNLVSRSDEENNWKDLGKSEEPATAGPAVERASVAGVDIKDASLNYRDEVEKSLSRLTHLNVKTGALGGTDPVPLHMDFDYDDGTPDSSMHIDIDSNAHIDSARSSVELRELKLKGRAGAGKDGTAFNVSAPVLAIDWKNETLAPAALTVQYGELPLRVTAAGEKILSNRVITGKIDMERVSPRDLMKSMGMEAPKARDPKALTALAMNAQYRLTENALALSNVALDLDDSHIRGTLGIDDLDTKALSFDITVDAIDVDRYREPEAKPGAPQAAAPPADLPHDAIRDLKAKGLMRIGRLKVADVQLTEVRLPVDAADGVVKLEPQAKLFGGGYDGNIQLDARSPKVRMTMNDHLRNVDVGTLANAAFKSKRLAGRGDANIALNGLGKTDTELLKSLAGKFDLNVREGAVNGVDLWYELRRAVALVKRTAAPTRTEPVRTPFKTMAGSATLSGGVVRNDDLRIDMDYIKASGKGTLAVESKAVNYRLVTEVYKLPEGSEGAAMADIKALEIPVSVTGTLSDMKIRPDVGDLLEAKVRKEVDKHKDVLKKKLDKKLQNLFDR